MTILCTCPPGHKAGESVLCMCIPVHLRYVCVLLGTIHSCVCDCVWRFCVCMCPSFFLLSPLYSLLLCHLLPVLRPIQGPWLLGFSSLYNLSSNLLDYWSTLSPPIASLAFLPVAIYIPCALGGGVLQSAQIFIFVCSPFILPLLNEEPIFHLWPQRALIFGTSDSTNCGVVVMGKGSDSNPTCLATCSHDLHRS